MLIFPYSTALTPGQPPYINSAQRYGGLVECLLRQLYIPRGTHTADLHG